MAITVKHAFVNPIADEAGFPGTKPSDWNADHVVTGGSSAAPPVNAVQFNDPLGTFAGVPEIIFLPGAEVVDASGTGQGHGLQIGGVPPGSIIGPPALSTGPGGIGGHLAVGNYGIIDYSRGAIGDPTEDDGWFGQASVIGITEKVGPADLTFNFPLSGYYTALNASITYSHTGAGGASLIAINAYPYVLGDSTGPVSELYGINLQPSYQGQGALGELAAVFAQPTPITTLTGTGPGHVTDCIGVDCEPFIYNQAATVPFVIGDVTCFYAATLAVMIQDFGAIETHIGNIYGLHVLTPGLGLTSTHGGVYQITNNYGIYLEDQSVAGVTANVGYGPFALTSPVKFENFHSAGATSINVIEGKFNFFGTASNASPGDGDLWYDSTHFYFRHGGTSVDLLAGGGLTVGSTPISGGTANYVLTIDPTNTFLTATPAGAATISIGSPITGGAGLGGVLYDDGSVTLQEASGFTISGGDGNIVSGQSLLYDGSPVIFAQPAQSNFFDGGSGNATNTGLYNTGTGVSALSGLTTGQKNSGIGYFAGAGITNGNSNLCIGYFAGFSMNGSGNFALGTGTLQSDTNATANTVIGAFNMGTGVGASFCVAIGTSCITNYTAPLNIIAIGNNCCSFPTGNDCIGIGHQALTTITSATHCIGIGNLPLSSLLSGTGNIGIGRFALAGVVSDDYNIGIGYFAGSAINGGTRNMCLGPANSGSNISTGNYNIVLGSHGGPTTQNGCFVLSDGNGTLLADYGLTIASVWKFAAPIAVNNAYVGTPIVPTGYITLQDSTGTTYKVAVSL